MLTKISTDRFCYYIDHLNRLQGESNTWDEYGHIVEHCFYVDNRLHGEFKRWNSNGNITLHCFFVNDEKVLFDVMPYPVTEEDRMFFMLKYDLQLIPVEDKC